MVGAETPLHALRSAYIGSQGQKHIDQEINMQRLYAAIAKILPYPLSHGVIGVLISLVSLSPSAGFFFYLGREIRDLQKAHNWDFKKFDWPGILYPAVPCLAADVWIKYQLYLMLAI